MASLMGLFCIGMSAQNGYYRIKNAYVRGDAKQYVHVTGAYEAQPEVTHDEAITLPGSVLHVTTADTVISGETVKNVKTLRAQGVDVINGYLVPGLDAVRNELKRRIKAKVGNILGEAAYLYLSIQVFDKWDLNMHLRATTTAAGDAAYYVYATVPSMQPLVDFYKTWGSFMGSALNNYPELKAALDEGNADKTWTAMEKLAYAKISSSFGASSTLATLLKGYIDNDRIHQGQTYYLIEGGISKVDSGSQYDPANPTTTSHNEYDNTNAKFDFANNNVANYYGPELEAAGDAGKWILEEVDATNYFAVRPSANMKGRDGKYYTTLYVDFSFEIAGDMKAYTIEGVNEKNASGYYFAKVKALGGQGTTVPAQTAVVLECPSTDVADNRLQPTGTETPQTSANRLCGNYFATAIAGMTATDGAGNTYAVTTDNIRAFSINSSDTKNPIGFYKVASSVTTVPGNKAFLVLTGTEAAAKGFFLQFDEIATDIDGVTVKEDETEHKVIYDLQGRRVESPTKGIYIVNGKKVVIK